MQREDIDPDLKYCPRCGDEYRADRENCAGCEVPLQLGAAILAATAEVSHPDAALREIGVDETAVSIRKGTMLQIKELQYYLKGCGLASRIAKEEGAGCGCGGPEVVLQVREQDLEQIMAALSEEYWHSTGLADHDTRYVAAVYDDRAEEALCPACGYRFSTRETTCPDCGLCFG